MTIYKKSKDKRRKKYGDKKIFNRMHYDDGFIKWMWK